MGSCWSLKNAKPLKLTVTTILVVIFITKIHEAYVKYQSKDTLIITKTVHPEKQTFPSVTLCKHSDNSFNFTAMPKVVNDLETWAYGWFDHKEISFDIHDPKSPWTSRPAVQYLGHRSCHTFAPPYNITPGIENRLEIKMKANPSDWVVVLLHDEKQNIPFPAETLDLAMHVFNIPTSQTKVHRIEMAVTTEKIRRLSTDQAPCQADPYDQGKGMFECMEDHFQNKVGKCVMPWNLDGKNNSITSNYSCDIIAYQQYNSYFKTLIDSPTYENFYNATGCIRSCENYVYTYSTPVSFNREAGPDNKVSIILGIFLKPKGVTLKKETLAFDVLDMVGNIGGYLGLLLGWSIFSIYDVVSKKVSKALANSTKSIVSSI